MKKLRFIMLDKMSWEEIYAKHLMVAERNNLKIVLDNRCSKRIAFQVKADTRKGLLIVSSPEQMQTFWGVPLDVYALNWIQIGGRFLVNQSVEDVRKKLSLCDVGGPKRSWVLPRITKNVTMGKRVQNNMVQK